MTLRIISLGGGVQSTALVVLATQGKLRDVDAAVFANVGDDSEDPLTLSFVRDVLTPWSAERGIPVIERRYTRRDGRVETLRQNIEGATRGVNFPIRLASGAFGNRKCSERWKIEVVRRYVRENGATKTSPATVLIGFSTDEAERLHNRPDHPIERKQYPLLFDIPMSRNDCRTVILKAGLPEPPKSSCYFCPFRSKQNFAEMARDRPALFAEAQAVEDAALSKRLSLGKDPGYLTDTGKRLSDGVLEAQPSLFGESPAEAGCDTGSCWT